MKKREHNSRNKTDGEDWAGGTDETDWRDAADSEIAAVEKPSAS